MTSADDRRALLQVARDAVLSHVTGQSASELPLTGALAAKGGAFVTLHVKGDLRGCIGHIAADDLLGRVVPRCAIAACSEDPRFPPLAASELPALEIELSLLGPLEPINGPHDFEIGRHGLVVERGWRRGLLLPQVATEWSWDRETFLSQTCRKAGLPLDAWRKGASLWRFEAEVFDESATSR
jgi:AmmeMemoRadiSam system protein A